LPAIITCRSVEEGGRQEVAHSIRLPLLIEGAKRFADYCDIEAAHYEEAAKHRPDLSKLIVSYHNFKETPANIGEIYERIVRLPAKIHKIAVRANRLSDTLAIFHLLERARQEGRTLIAIAMNEAGMITRFLGCSRGSFLTYGALAEGKPSAPGQISCRELKELYRINGLSSATPITGLIGNPVSHSLSPVIHNAMFAALELDGVYLPLVVDDPEEFFKRFVRVVSREVAFHFRGFSVTIPHKIAVLPLLD
jgi:3-dehydroquinate dehydratase/shikimate dehydrogenase